MTVAELVVKILFQSNDPQALLKLKSGLKGAHEETGKLAQGITAINLGLSAMNNAGQKAFLVLSQIPRIPAGGVIRLGVNSLPSGGTIPMALHSGGGGSGMGPGGGPAGEGIGGPLGPVLGNLAWNPEAQLLSWNLKKIGKELGLFAVAIDLLNVGMTKIVETTGQAARLLTSFRVNTGGDTQGLQRLAGALNVQGVSPGETMGMIQAIRDAQAAVKLGQGNAAPFQFFGISADEKDVDKILAQVQRMSKILDPNLARQFAEQLGISANIFQGLMQANLSDTGKIMSEQDIRRMKEFNQEWNRLGRDTGQLGQQVATILAPAFEKVFGFLEAVLADGERFIAWLKRPEMEIARKAIEGMVVALLALGAALTALAGGAFVALLVYLAPELAAAVAAVVLLGAAFGVIDSLVGSIADGIAYLIDGLKSIPEWFGAKVGQAVNWMEGIGDNYVAPILRNPGGVTINQTNHNSVSVDGAQQPHETARQVHSILRQTHVQALATSPLAAY